MSCDENTKGIAIAPFSDYGSSEKEVLLASNIFEISSMKEENGKIIFDGDAISSEFDVNLEL